MLNLASVEYFRVWGDANEHCSDWPAHSKIWCRWRTNLVQYGGFGPPSSTHPPVCMTPTLWYDTHPLVCMTPTLQYDTHPPGRESRQGPCRPSAGGALERFVGEEAESDPEEIDQYSLHLDLEKVRSLGGVQGRAEVL